CPARATSPEEVEWPPERAISPIGREFEAVFLLLGDDLRDLGVFSRLETARRDLTLLALFTRLFERRRAQERTDMIGAEGRLCSCGHGHISSGIFLSAVSIIASDL